MRSREHRTRPKRPRSRRSARRRAIRDRFEANCANASGRRAGSQKPVASPVQRSARRARMPAAPAALEGRAEGGETLPVTIGPNDHFGRRSGKSCRLPTRVESLVGSSNKPVRAVDAAGSGLSVLNRYRASHAPGRTSRRSAPCRPHSPVPDGRDGRSPSEATAYFSRNARAT